MEKDFCGNRLWSFMSSMTSHQRQSSPEIGRHAVPIVQPTWGHSSCLVHLLHTGWRGRCWWMLSRWVEPLYATFSSIATSKTVSCCFFPSNHIHEAVFEGLIVHPE